MKRYSRFLIPLLAGLFCAGQAPAQVAPNPPGAGLTTQTWPAGTVLSDFPHGGRITTFHRGLLYLGGTGNQRTWVYDISNPSEPRLRCDWETEDNSHVWYKVGDLLYRQNLLNYGQTPPTFTSLAGFSPAGCPATRQNWTTPFYNFPLTAQVPGDDWIATYPYAFNYRVLNPADNATLSYANVWADKGVTSTNRFRLGNLLFFTPGDGQDGIAVFDISNPLAPRLLDRLDGNIKQYTTTLQVWRHYLVLMHGDSENGPDADANVLVVDFSDPTDLKLAWTIPLEDMPGRYVHFQDDYAFSGHKTLGGVKYDMVNRRVERRFPHPVSVWEWFTDFQWIPLGHLLMVSGSEPTGSRTFLFTHQDGRDTNPPQIGYHLPQANAANQPLTTAIGLVINEQLDSTTVNDQTIQLRPLGGEPLPTVIVHTSFDVVSVVPVEKLQPDTTYEVRLVAGGLRDVAGNGVEEQSFFFSTGDTLQVAPEIHALNLTPEATAAAPLRAGQLIGFSAEVENADEYRWDFGDGVQTAWSASLAATHTYASPGVYVPQLQVRNRFGQAVSATRRVAINPGTAADAAAASNSVLVDAAARRVWVLNPDHGSFAVFNADTQERLRVQAVCSDPRSLAQDSAGQVWIACRGDDRVVALDADARVVAELGTGYGSAPAAVLFDSTGTTGYATLGGSGELLRFDPASASGIDRIRLGFHAESLARAGTRLYAARLKSADHAGEVRAVDIGSFTLADSIELPLDTTSPDSGTAGRGLANYVASMAVSPDASRVWYAAKKDNIVRGVARDGLELTFDNTVRVMVGAVDTASAAEVVPARRDIDNSALALGLTPSPAGALLFVALGGNDRVVAIDPWRGGEYARVDTGSVPRGLAVDPLTRRLWVRNDLSRTVSVYDVDDLVVKGSGEMTLLATSSSVNGEMLTDQQLRGKVVFYRAEDPRMSGDGYISCASCHLDGGADHRVWDFTERGEGLRRTLSMKGRAGMAHGPLHWSANFDEVQDFENDIRDRFGGTGLMSDAHFLFGTRSQPLGMPKAGLSADLDALAAYADTLDSVGRSPYRAADGSLTASAMAGRELFLQKGCANCHGGSGFTDSPRKRWHDVGTVAAGDMRAGRPLQGLDTPTLRGLWEEDRLLHDGRAADVIESLTLASGDRHGGIGTLDADERAQLRDYVLSIDDSEPTLAEPFELRLLSPLAGQVVDPGQGLRLAVATDLDGIARIEVLLDGEVVATMAAAPWEGLVPVTAGSTPVLQLRAVHASGAVTYTWPQPLTVSAQIGGMFRDGFEGAAH